jgi:cytochrome P450
MTDLELPLHDPTTYQNGFPHEYFRELREHGAVFHAAHPSWERGYWVVVRHPELTRVSRETEHFRNAPHPFLEQGAGDDQSGTSGLLISLDAPEHQKMRLLIQKGFTPKRVADLEQKVRERVERIISDLADRNSADLVEDLALWLPLHVIADLVGVPEADRRQVFEWTEKTFGFDPAVTAEERSEAAMAMYMYADAMCEERQDDPRDDLMSVLLHAEVDGERLTQMQLDLFFMLLQNAGSETTRNLITTGTVELLKEPDQYRAVQQDHRMIPIAIEELLRHATPVMQFTRTAITDIELGGQQIRAGDRVLMVYSSANRDAAVFDDPDRIDVTRSPNPHVAFGAGGPHFCLGANLARLEGRVMFETILSRFEGLRVEADESSLRRVNSNLIDGFAEVPIGWDAIR